MPASAHDLARLLAIVVVATVGAGIVAELGYYEAGWPGGFVEFFSLSDEANLPTWVSSILLFSCSLSLASIGDGQTSSLGSNQFRVLATIFAFMSLDEAVEIHEHLGGLVDGRGIFYFSWIIPASIVVALVFAYTVPLLRSLPPPARRGFLVSGGVYVLGALGMELPLGWYAERYGDATLGYAAIDAVEEALELIGISWFLVTLARLREARESEVAS